MLEIESEDIYNHKFLYLADLMTGCPPISKSHSFMPEYNSLLNYFEESSSNSNHKSKVSPGRINDDFDNVRAQEQGNITSQDKLSIINEDNLVNSIFDSKQACLEKDNLDMKKSDLKKTSDNGRKRYFLDKRQDVLNKTLMRSLKRYLTQEFFNGFKFMELSANEKTKNFGAYLKSYVMKNYENKISQSSCQISIKTLTEYVGYIIDAERTKRVLKNKASVQFNRLYYEVLDRYSHK